MIIRIYVPALHHSDLCTGLPSFGLTYRPSIIWTYVLALMYQPLLFRVMYRLPIIWTYVLALIIRTYVLALHHSDLCSGPHSIIQTYIPTPHHLDLCTDPHYSNIHIRPHYSDLCISHHHYSNLRTGLISSESQISLSAFKPFMQGSSFSKQTRCQYLFM